LSKEFKLLAQKLLELKQFGSQEIEKLFRNFVAELNLKSRDLIHPLRAAVTGSLIGPGLFEVISLLGKEKVCNRIFKAAQLMESYYRNYK